MLVAPGEPNGTPATTMMRSPMPAKPFGEAGATGAVGHVVDVARVLGDDRMHAPDERQAAGGVDIGRQRQDRHARPLARDAQARSRPTPSRPRWP